MRGPGPLDRGSNPLGAKHHFIHYSFLKRLFLTKELNSASLKQIFMSAGPKEAAKTAINEIEDVESRESTERTEEQTIQKAEEKQRNEEAHTAQITQRIEEGDVSESALNEDVKEQRQEVSLAKKVLNGLMGVCKEKEGDLQELTDVERKLQDEEVEGRQLLDQIETQINTINNQGITEERLRVSMSNLIALYKVIYWQEIIERHLERVLYAEIEDLETLGYETAVEKHELRDEIRLEEEGEKIASRLGNRSMMAAEENLEQKTNSEKSMADRLVSKEREEMGEVRTLVGKLNEEEQTTSEEEKDADFLAEKMEETIQRVDGRPSGYSFDAAQEMETWHQKVEENEPENLSQVVNLWDNEMDGFWRKKKINDLMNR